MLIHLCYGELYSYQKNMNLHLQYQTNFLFTTSKMLLVIFTSIYLATVHNWKCVFYMYVNNHRLQLTIVCILCIFYGYIIFYFIILLFYYSNFTLVESGRYILVALFFIIFKAKTKVFSAIYTFCDFLFIYVYKHINVIF